MQRIRNTMTIPLICDLPESDMELPDAQKAYKEWMRVLKPGGVLLNFDANYGAVDFTDTSELPKNHAHNQN